MKNSIFSLLLLMSFTCSYAGGAHEFPKVSSGTLGVNYVFGPSQLTPEGARLLNQAMISQFEGCISDVRYKYSKDKGSTICNTQIIVNQDGHKHAVSYTNSEGSKYESTIDRFLNFPGQIVAHMQRDSYCAYGNESLENLWNLANSQNLWCH